MGEGDKLKVLVTGGKGFIGSNLVRILKSNGYKVKVFDLWEYDLTSQKDVNHVFSTFKPRVVFHLGAVLGTAETFANPVHTAEVNIIGTLSVLEAALRHSCLFIYTSKPPIWVNPYTITKVCAEMFIEMYHKIHGLKTVVLRLHNVYGPGQKSSPVEKAIPIFTEHALRGEDIPVYGDGEQKPDWVYIDDVVDALVLAMEKKPDGKPAIDIGTGVSTSVNDVVKQVLKLTGSKSQIRYLPLRLGEGPEKEVRADITKAAEFLGWKPKVSLEEGLRKTIPYYRRMH